MYVDDTKNSSRVLPYFHQRGLWRDASLQPKSKCNTCYLETICGTFKGITVYIIFIN